MRQGLRVVGARTKRTWSSTLVAVMCASIHLVAGPAFAQPVSSAPRAWVPRQGVGQALQVAAAAARGALVDIRQSGVSPRSRQSLLDAFDQVRASVLLAAADSANAVERVGSVAGSATAAIREQAMVALYDTEIANLLQEIDSVTAVLQSTAFGSPVPAIELLLVHLDAAVGQPDRTPLAARSAYGSWNLAVAAPQSSPMIVPAYTDIRLPAPAAADLAATVEIDLGPEIVARAAALHHNAIEIVEFVRNDIDVELYHGAMKRASETLRQKRGNDVDQASLLLALMRASGIPGRYVRGVIALNGVQAMSWTGTASTAQAAEALARSGIPFTPIRQGAGIGQYQIEHTWTEVFVPYGNYRGAPLDPSRRTWVPLDPSFKSVVHRPGLDFRVAADFRAERIVGEYLAGPQPVSAIDFYKEQITTYLSQARPDLSFDQGVAAWTTEPSVLGLLPNTLPYATPAITQEFSAVPESLRHSVRFVAQGEDRVAFDVVVPTAELLGRRVTLSYVPATVEDQATVDAFSGLDNTPAYLVKLRPVLKVGGVVRAAGEAAVQMGATHRVTIDLVTPRGTMPISNELVAGGYYAIGFAGQRAIYEPPATPAPDDTEVGAGDLLFRMAIDYLERWNQAERTIGAILDVSHVRPVVSEVMVGTLHNRTMLFGAPQSMVWRGVFVDADVRVSDPIAMGADGSARQEFMRLAGLAGSMLESDVLHDMLGAEAVSAARVIQLAHAGAIPVVEIDASNAAAQIAGLDTADIVKSEVADAANQGWRVTIPHGDLTTNIWTGIGYIAVDPATGAGGYFISGSLAGGSTSTDPNDWAIQELRNELAYARSPRPNTDPGAATSIRQVDITDHQTGIVGQPLPRALAVLVQDRVGRPVEGAQVSFTVLAGGGSFASACAPGAGTVVAFTNYVGVATATPCLGTHTADAPMYVLLNPTDTYPTRVGNNIFTASVRSALGDLVLENPFQQFAAPGVPDHLVKALGGETPLTALAGRWAGTVSARVEDRYNNPVSNARINFLVRTPVLYSEPQWAQDPLATPYAGPPPAGAKNLAIYTTGSCGIAIPALGDCNGVSTLTLETSVFGAYVDTILGNTLNTRFRLEAAVSGPCTGLCVDTFSLYSRGSRPYGTGEYNKPVLWMTTMELVTDRGDLLNAAKVGTQFQRPLETALFVIEDEYEVAAVNAPGVPCGGASEPPCWTMRSLETNRTRPVDAHKPGTIRFADGTGGVDVPKRSENGAVSVTPVAGNGSVAPSPAANPGEGRYQTYLTVGPNPMLNRVRVDGDADVWAPYLDQATGDVIPVLAHLKPGQAVSTFTAGTSGPSPVIVGTPFTLTHEVFGVRLTAARPSNLPLNDLRLAMADTDISYAIEPVEYIARTAEVDLFEKNVSGGADTWLGLIVGDHLSAAGNARIYRGTPFSPSKSYRLEGVLNRGSSAEIRSAPVNLTFLSGTLTYTRYPVTASGLDYAHEYKPPIRGAIIELRDLAGNLLDTQKSTDKGFVSFVAPDHPVDVHMVVKAAIGDPAAPRVKIADNTSGNALYELACPDFISTGSESASKDCNAESGWNGTAYSGPHKRESGPFAILDVIYQAEKLVRGADPGAVFPPLNVYWSPCNQDDHSPQVSDCLPVVPPYTIPDPSRGLIGGTFYRNSTGSIYVRGLADVDTDEYDTHVIAHEWAHYFLYRFSRSESPGGDHDRGDFLDPRTAYAEGAATAIGAVALDNSVYIDTSGPGQKTASSFDLSDAPDMRINSDGFPYRGLYAEHSVARVLWRLANLGFKPLYDVFTVDQVSTPAFATMTTFLWNLERRLDPAVAALVQIIGGDELIPSDDIYGPFYMDIPLDGVPVDKDPLIDSSGQEPLSTIDLFGPVTSGNKLLNTRWFRFDIPAGQQFEIQLRPDSASGQQFFFSLYRNAQLIQKMWTTLFGNFASIAIPVQSTTTTYVVEVGSTVRAGKFGIRICAGKCQ